MRRILANETILVTLVGISFGLTACASDANDTPVASYVLAPHERADLLAPEQPYAPYPPSPKTAR